MLPKKLDSKYAKMWIDANMGNIPKGLEPFKIHQPLSQKEKEMFSTGIWVAVNQMVSDDLISSEMLRHWHNKEEGWNNQSKIKDGYNGKKRFSVKRSWYN